MKRAYFLRALVALPFAPAALERMADLPRVTIIGPYDVMGNPESLTSVVRSLAWPTLRYNVPEAKVTQLAKTGDAEKRMVSLRGRSGIWVHKSVLLTGCFLAVTDRPGRRSELAYQVCKRFKEAARDIAHREGINWRRNERLWQWEWRTDGR